ncbi:MAG: DUF58 domain-containing protein [Pseudomonadota bacterium]
MRPASKQLRYLSLVVALGLIILVLPQAFQPWLALVAAFILLLMIDLVRLWRAPAPQANRRIGSTLAVGVARPVTISVSNTSSYKATIDLHDHYPEIMQVADQPMQRVINAGSRINLVYTATPMARGRHAFGDIDLRVHSPRGWWMRRHRIETHNNVRVFPNFASVSKYAVLGVESEAASGVQFRQRRGEGSEFHQLREYREGDTFRQIDWKATARLTRLITKEYQEERDQQIVFLVDTGRRMLTREGELSHFDHTLNAMLLLSYVALRQGDAVGFQTFGADERWVKPRKGMTTMSALTRQLFELEPEELAVDYQAAATALAARQKRRALVVLLTNIRDEDLDDLKVAFGLLCRRHVLLVASIREPGIDDVLERPVTDFHSARDYAAAHHYLQARRRTLEALNARGVILEDTSCDDLPRAIARRYLDIKRAGVL